MVTTIPLEVYLKTHELTEGTTLIVHTDMWKSVMGEFVGMKRGDYVIKLTEVSPVFGEVAVVPVANIHLPINVQKFYVLDSDDPELKTFI